MSASSVGSEHGAGTVRIVPETEEIVAVCLEGDFDLANAPALGEEIDRVLSSGNNVILDLREATFIDSSVVHVLVRAVNTAREGKRTMVLELGTAAVVQRALTIVGFEHTVPLAHDREEAVRMIQRQAETV